MTTLLKRPKQVRLTEVMRQLKLSLVEIQELLNLLELHPHLNSKQAYLNQLQVELVNKLYLHLRSGKSPQEFLTSLSEAYLYECQNCGDLKLCAYPLHHEGLLHNCKHYPWRLLEHPSGELKLIATGPYDRLLGWAHSKSIGLDNPMKGI